MFKEGALVTPTDQFFKALEKAANMSIKILPFSPTKDTICTVKTTTSDNLYGWTMTLEEIQPYENGIERTFVCKFWEEVLPPMSLEESEKLTTLINASQMELV